jgi:fermentation-respiration switch protein FrsA (DUF1100 family)
MNWTLYLIIFTPILFMICLFIYFFQEYFIFLNGKKIAKNYRYTFSNKFEEVFIKTDGNNEINALHFQLQNPKGVVLFCHGNKGNLISWGKRVACFLAYNQEVLVFDYRNYGKSTGKFHEENMYKDALVVYESLKKKFKEENIVVYGFSLGSTFATRIASTNTPKALILEAPFYNFKKAVQYHSKYVPTFLLKYQFRTDRDISKVRVPITLFHGNQDQTTSFVESKKLLDLNTSTKNEFLEIENGTHHNIKEFPVFKEKLKEILAR